MKIVGCNTTEKTTDRLKDLIPLNLLKENILLNIGYSGFKKENDFEGLIFNRTENFKNCVN